MVKLKHKKKFLFLDHRTRLLLTYRKEKEQNMKDLFEEIDVPGTGLCMFEAINAFLRALLLCLLDVNNRNPIIAIGQMIAMIEKLRDDGKLDIILADMFIKDFRELGDKPLSDLPQEPCLLAIGNWYKLRIVVWDEHYKECKIYNNSGQRSVFLHLSNKHYNPIVPKVEFYDADSGIWPAIADGYATKIKMAINQPATDALLKKIRSEQRKTIITVV